MTLSGVLAQTSRTIATGVLLVGMCLAQQTSQEPAQPTLHVQTDLVLIPFQVRRGSRSVSDLKPTDVVLLEDGIPRSFTGFEAPPDHPSLELIVGISTGGRSFEAPRRPESQSGDGLDRFSMTGSQVSDILETVKRHALARFTSSYTVWIAPSLSGAPRKHKLEVKLAPKSSGKLSDGKRSAIY